MDNAEKMRHAAMLRAALDASSYSRQDIADATGRSYRTVGNWITTKKPTVPTSKERAVIRTLLGAYDAPGDDVERAIRGSDLTEDRQYDVIGYYKRRLREQREERAG